MHRIVLFIQLFNSRCQVNSIADNRELLPKRRTDRSDYRLARMYADADPGRRDLLVRNIFLGSFQENQGRFFVDFQLFTPLRAVQNEDD